MECVLVRVGGVLSWEMEHVQKNGCDPPNLPDLKHPILIRLFIACVVGGLRRQPSMLGG